MSDDVKDLVRAQVTPEQMIASAIERGIDPAGIETLSRVYLEIKAQEAEMAFNEAMVAFQAECPIVVKARTIEFPTKRGAKFKSQYAEMDDIIEATRELRQRYGFAFMFKREYTDRLITVTCTISHTKGHRRETSFSVPIPTDVLISEQHSYAGAVTFAERYAFRAAFGITTGQPDDEGKAFATGGAITDEQHQKLLALVQETRADSPAFYSFCGITKLDDLKTLPATQYDKVEQALLRRKGILAEQQKGRQA